MKIYILNHETNTFHYEDNDTAQVVERLRELKRVGVPMNHVTVLTTDVYGNAQKYLNVWDPDEWKDNSTLIEPCPTCGTNYMVYCVPGDPMSQTHLCVCNLCGFGENAEPCKTEQAAKEQWNKIAKAGATGATAASQPPADEVSAPEDFWPSVL